MAPAAELLTATRFRVTRPAAGAEGAEVVGVAAGVGEAAEAEAAVEEAEAVAPAVVV